MKDVMPKVKKGKNAYEMSRGYGNPVEALSATLKKVEFIEAKKKMKRR